MVAMCLVNSLAYVTEHRAKLLIQMPLLLFVNR
jgi:hypothetical protein